MEHNIDTSPSVRIGARPISTENSEPSLRTANRVGPAPMARVPDSATKLLRCPTWVARRDAGRSISTGCPINSSRGKPNIFSAWTFASVITPSRVDHQNSVGHGFDHLFKSLAGACQFGVLDLQLPRVPLRCCFGMLARDGQCNISSRCRQHLCCQVRNGLLRKYGAYPNQFVAAKEWMPWQKPSNLRALAHSGSRSDAAH